MRVLTRMIAVLILAGFALPAQAAPDLILHNGKIVTVDEMFSIRDAVAIDGERFVAVGSDAEVMALAGDATRVVDLGGRTVIPGLIDNHNHIIRATEYWAWEARLDGVATRAEAVRILREKAATLPRGAWLFSLGGWTEDQFRDDSRGFTRAELDDIAPGRPAFLQVGYDHVYVNSAWFEAMDIPLRRATDAGEAQGLEAFVIRTSGGEATGRLTGGFPMIGQAIARFPEVTEAMQRDGVMALMSEFNAMGLTTVYDAGGLGIRPESYTRLADYDRQGLLTLRMPHNLWGGVIRTPAEAATFSEALERERPFQGTAMFDRIAAGEIFYAPFHWDNRIAPAEPGPEAMEVATKMLRTAARNGWPVELHAIQPETIGHILDAVAEVSRTHAVRPLKWSICHADNISAAQIARLRDLGMTLKLRSMNVVGGLDAVFAAHDEDVYHMPPFHRLAASGVLFGIGSDGTKVAQSNPFVNLWWAVTGRMLNGETILKQTLSREQALIAHTRANARILFQGQKLGQIRPGFLADMVVLDRDYMTVPEDDIREIAPVATLVGGRVVYGALE